MTAPQSIRLDAIIFGGGVAGMWILDEVRRAGHAAAMVESHALGSGQTAGSQGIIHGGLKYTLTGLLSPAARAIREMPEHWRVLLSGNGEPNLASTHVRAQSCYLWRTSTLTSMAGMLGARFGLRVAPVTITEPDRPEALRGCPGTVARLDEQVVDPVSLLETFRCRNEHFLARVPSASWSVLERRDDGGWSLRFTRPDGTWLAVGTRHVVLAAGSGIPSLRAAFGLSTTCCQTRPLHMVMVRGAPDRLPPLFGHCVDGNRTRVTVTTAVDRTGRNIWQVGGQIAEDGVALSRSALIGRARQELALTIPGLDWTSLEWSSYHAIRAEPSVCEGARPDDIGVRLEQNVISAWPTKLALAPRLATRVLATLGPHCADPDDARTALAPFERPAVALPPWEIESEWSPS